MAVQYTVQTPSVVGDDRFRSTTWTYDEQDEYKALLKGAFTCKAIQQVLERNLYFHTEVEAFAHYLMHNAQKYRAIFPKTADTTVLGLDFGGLSMSGCPFRARASPCVDAAAFFRLGDPFGAGGGTEHWESYISEFCTEETLKPDGPDRKKSFLDESLPNGSPAFNVARGAALATSKSITVNEYLSNGAAFGIQMLQRDLHVPKQVSGGRVASNNEVWDDTAAIRFNQKHRSTDITTSGTDRLKIICDPFHGRGNKAGLLLAHDRCYDVVELPIPKKGTWRFTVDSVRQGHDGERMFLQLSRRRLGEVSTEVPVLHLELYFDRTANCYLIYDGNGKIDDAHRGLALTDDDQLVACSSATTSPQVEEAAPVPEGTPQAKRMMKRTWQMAPMARLPFTPTKRAKPVATSSGTNDTP
ncbi:hypothetical protein K4K57_006026 [Colletotrichum sp. SAR 10_99]|nr:hypothetical protein K4K55_007767 [Colletotrichum sp. SAR 10_96]KAJ5018224.1 hypothetical protein K4K57_006026 [Colletotrichum sp. SAR 10_99]